MAGSDYGYSWWCNGKKVKSTVFENNSYFKIYIDKGHTVALFRDGIKIHAISFQGDENSEHPITEKHTYQTGSRVVEVVFEVNNGQLTAYVKMTCPDGTIWEGFGGYGIGDGFENNDYGRDYQKAVERLKMIFVP